jgi:hypothetical protein
LLEAKPKELLKLKSFGEKVYGIIGPSRHGFGTPYNSFLGMKCFSVPLSPFSLETYLLIYRI